MGRTGNELIFQSSKLALHGHGISDVSWGFSYPISDALVMAVIGFCDVAHGYVQPN